MNSVLAELEKVDSTSYYVRERALSLTNVLLCHRGVSLQNAGVRELLTSTIYPSFKQESSHIRALAIRALGLYCLLTQV